jgi:hypothetical protein
MSMTADKIVAEALGLSPQARAFVAERLIESLDTAESGKPCFIKNTWWV